MMRYTAKPRNGGSRTDCRRGGRYAGRFHDEGAHGRGDGEVLARLGYALVGALVAVLVSAMMSLVPWPADDTLFPVYVNASVMGATLMLWRRSSFARFGRRG